MISPGPDIQFPWQNMWFFTSSFFLAWSELIFTILKWTGVGSKVLLPVDICSTRHTEGDHDNQIQVWIRKWVIFLCKELRWKKLIYLHSTTAGLVMLPEEVVSVTSSASLMSNFYPARKKKAKILGKKNPANIPQGGFFFCVLVFICWDGWGFLCLGNLDIKSKPE